MQINNVCGANFNGIKYVKSPANTLEKGYLEKIQERSPSIKLKEIIEKSPFFKNLAIEKDVYVYSGKDESRKDPFWSMVATIAPSNANAKSGDELLLIGSGATEEKWFAKLKKMVDKLPENYDELLNQGSCLGGIIHLNNVNGVLFFAED